MTDRPYPNRINKWQTHHKGCWKDPGHHNCATDRVYALKAENAALREALANLAECTSSLIISFNMSRLVMDAESRKMSGDFLDAAREIVREARAALKGGQT